MLHQTKELKCPLALCHHLPVRQHLPWLLLRCSRAADSLGSMIDLDYKKTSESLMIVIMYNFSGYSHCSASFIFHPNDLIELVTSQISSATLLKKKKKN